MSFDFQDFLSIYHDPFWVESIPGGLSEGSVPSIFDEVQLYQGMLVELEHTSDPYMATEIAMDHLTEDPDYYQKLKIMEAANRYRRNPRSYEEMSLGELQKEERRLLETIDDYRYFKEDPNKIAVLEKELDLLRKAMSPERVTTIESDLPEADIQQQVVVLFNDIKTLKSLERASMDVGAIEKVAAHRRTRLGLEETIESIQPLLQRIASNRIQIATTKGKINQLQTEIGAAEQQMAELAAQLSSSSMEIMNAAMKKGDDLAQRIRGYNNAMYRGRQELTAATNSINEDLKLAEYRLRVVGYVLPTRQAPPVKFTSTPPIIEAAPPQQTALPTEVTAIYEQTSTDPAIAALQNKLRRAVEELTIAIEDNSPPYILRPIEAQVAKLHEEIEKRTAKRYRRYHRY